MPNQPKQPNKIPKLQKIHHIIERLGPEVTDILDHNKYDKNNKQPLTEKERGFMLGYFSLCCIIDQIIEDTSDTGITAIPMDPNLIEKYLKEAPKNKDSLPDEDNLPPELKKLLDSLNKDELKGAGKVLEALKGLFTDDKKD